MATFCVSKASFCSPGPQPLLLFLKRTRENVFTLLCLYPGGGGCAQAQALTPHPYPSSDPSGSLRAGQEDLETKGPMCAEAQRLIGDLPPGASVSSHKVGLLGCREDSLGHVQRSCEILGAKPVKRLWLLKPALLGAPSWLSH